MNFFVAMYIKIYFVVTQCILLSKAFCKLLTLCSALKFYSQAVKILPEIHFLPPLPSELYSHEKPQDKEEPPLSWQTVL